MYYLGISYGWHDPAVCLLKENKIIAICEEERLIRFKHAHLQVPINAIKFCLKKANISLRDIDKIGINWSSYEVLKHFNKPSIKKLPGSLFFFRDISRRKKKLQSILKLYFGFSPQIIEIPHHITHFYSSFPFSGFNKALSITIDGEGEKTATCIFSNKEKLYEFFIPNSLGLFYGRVTEWLGFKFADGEGKTMGLAPYGSNPELLKDKYSYANGKYWVEPKIYEYLEKTFGPRRTGEIKQVHKDIALSAQTALEEIMLHLVEHYQEITGYKNLCLAGGVALNCKMNGVLLESGLIKDIFIQPLANDAGCAIGAAAYLATQDGYKFKKLEHVYYGPEYSDEEIEHVLKEAKVKYEKISDPAGYAAELIAKGKIVGWFQGRMECGPRALGNRSILADPRNPKTVDIINYYVKHREPWRPFCPSLLDRAKKRYMKKPYDAPFMILAFNTTEKAHEEIPAVLHRADKTMRPQTVTRKANPLYYRLIREFEKLTDIPVVLNTSFNVAGEPIVCSPKDALGTFFKCGMDSLIMGNYLVRK